MDEKWVLYTNIKKGMSWQTKGKPGIKAAREKRFPKKVLISVFWDRYGVIYRDVLPNKQTVTAEYYQYQICELYRQLFLKRPWYFEGEILPQLFFRHDNASPHRAASTKGLLEELGFKVLAHPPYSPDLAPSDFHLFRSLQNYLNKQNFIDRENLIKALDCYFNIQPQEFYRRGIYKMEEKWILAINAWGEYFN
jgi:histone-lysine N-methyltransferase SETMAR